MKFRPLSGINAFEDRCTTIVNQRQHFSRNHPLYCLSVSVIRVINIERVLLNLYQEYVDYIMVQYK